VLLPKFYPSFLALAQSFCRIFATGPTLLILVLFLITLYEISKKYYLKLFFTKKELPN